MARSRQASRARASWGRATALIALAPLAAGAGWLWLDQSSGLRPLWRARAELVQERERIGGLARERGELLGKVRRLRSEPLALEAEARERLGMVRPGEIVIQWQPAGRPD